MCGHKLSCISRYLRGVTRSTTEGRLKPSRHHHCLRSEGLVTSVISKGESLSSRPAPCTYHPVISWKDSLGGGLGRSSSILLNWGDILQSLKRRSICLRHGHIRHGNVAAIRSY